MYKQGRMGPAALLGWALGRRDTGGGGGRGEGWALGYSPCVCIWQGTYPLSSLLQDPLWVNNYTSAAEMHWEFQGA